jgi:hypothetical protein
MRRSVWFPFQFFPYRFASRRLGPLERLPRRREESLAKEKAIPLAPQRFKSRKVFKEYSWWNDLLYETNTPTSRQTVKRAIKGRRSTGFSSARRPHLTLTKYVGPLSCAISNKGRLALQKIWDSGLGLSAWFTRKLAFHKYIPPEEGSVMADPLYRVLAKLSQSRCRILELGEWPISIAVGFLSLFFRHRLWAGVPHSRLRVIEPTYRCVIRKPSRSFYFGNGFTSVCHKDC